MSAVTALTLAPPPAPLVPPDCDLGAFDWFPLKHKRLIRSKWWKRASYAARALNVELWCNAYQETPAGSLPDDDFSLSDMLGFGRVDLSAWLAIKAEVLSPWLLCSDGRWYHPTLCEVVLETWDVRLKTRERERLKKKAQRDGKNRVPRGQNSSETLAAQGDVAADKSCPPNVPRLTGQDRTTQDSRIKQGGDLPSPVVGSRSAEADAPEKPKAKIEPEKPNPKKGPRRIPLDWLASPKLRDWALAQGHDDASINRIEDEFRDFWLASASPKALKLDWEAAFRTWVRNEAKFAMERRNGRTGTSPHGGSNRAGPMLAGAMAAVDRGRGRP